MVEGWEVKIHMSLKQSSYETASETRDPYREGWLHIPSHGPNGEELERPKDNCDDLVSDSVPFIPGLLTPEQKASLIGSVYKVYANNRRFSRGEDPSEQVVIEERNFCRLYYRPDEIVSEEAKNKLADKMSIALPLAVASRRR